MKRNWLYLTVAFALGFILGCPALPAQVNTTVSGTLTDTGGTVWNGATVAAVFKPTPGFSGKYTWNGVQYNAIPPPAPVVANGSGVFSFNVPNNTTIVPAGTGWSFTITPLASVVAVNTPSTIITGASQSVTGFLAPYLTAPIINPTNVQMAYTDAEVQAAPGQGQMYYRTSDGTYRSWDGTMWNPFGGGGGGGTPSGPNCSAQIDNNGSFGGTTANLYADCFAGADIGAKINAAFLAATGSSGTPAAAVLVHLSPNARYSYSTTITLPNSTSSPYIESPTLDGHGSLLTYTGSGSPLTMLGQNTNNISGGFQNVNIVAINSAAKMIVYSRVHGLVQNNYIAVPITFINDTTHGGPGYFEENQWLNNHLVVAANSCGMTFQEDAGLGSGGSFFYDTFTGHLDLTGPNSNGVCMHDSGNSIKPVMQGPRFAFDVNNGGNTDAVWKLEPATHIFRGVASLVGENTGGGTPVYDAYVASNSSSFEVFGTSKAPGFVHGYGGNANQADVIFKAGDQAVTDDFCASIAGTKTESFEATSNNNERNSKNIGCGGTTVIALASNGGTENNGNFVVGYRNTTSTCSDVDVSGCGNPFTYYGYFSALYGTGFGASFSIAPNVVSGTDISKPKSRLAPEFRKCLTIRDPQATNTIIADGGGLLNACIDSTTGDMLFSLNSGSASGQPSNWIKWQARNYFDLTTHDLFKCRTNNAADECVVTGNLTIAGATSSPKYTATGTGPAFQFPLDVVATVTCNGTNEGTLGYFTDSNTVTWGATITGGSTNHVLAVCDGTNWTVVGK